MDKIIHKKMILNCNFQQAFEWFTQNDKVEIWLAKKTNIDPVVGGKYELFWDTENVETNSTLGCKITAIEINKLLSFEWKGPEQFADFMNTRDPLTHVTILFYPIDNHKTEAHLLHTGWGNNENWEEARLWFDSVWENALNQLVDIHKNIHL